MTREEKLVEALQWCGGSADFNEGGKARKGWLKTCAPLLKEPASIAQQPKPGSQETLTQIAGQMEGLLNFSQYILNNTIRDNLKHWSRQLRALA